MSSRTSKHLKGVLPSSIHRSICFRRSPPETVASKQTHGVTASFIPSSVVQVRSSISLANVQTVPSPPLPAGATPAASNYSIRLLTSSPSSKSPLYMIRAPIDRTAATVQGSGVWRVYMKSWVTRLMNLSLAGVIWMHCRYLIPLTLRSFLTRQKRYSF